MALGSEMEEVQSNSIAVEKCISTMYHHVACTKPKKKTIAVGSQVLSHPNILSACSAFLETRLPAGSRRPRGFETPGVALFFGEMGVAPGTKPASQTGTHTLTMILMEPIQIVKKHLL